MRRREEATKEGELKCERILGRKVGGGVSRIPVMSSWKFNVNNAFPIDGGGVGGW